MPFVADLNRELTLLPRLPSWFPGGRFAAGEGKGRRGKRGGREGEVSVPPLIYNLTAE